LNVPLDLHSDKINVFLKSKFKTFIL